MKAKILTQLEAEELQIIHRKDLFLIFIKITLSIRLLKMIIITLVKDMINKRKVYLK